MRHTLHTLITLSVLFLAGCTTGFSPRDQTCPAYDDVSGEATILAIGDSVFAWRMRTCETVPDVAAIELGRGLRHKAVNGARISGGDYPIVDQYEKGPWEWVIVDGGGNDLNNECECGVNCDGVLNTLISEDGSSGEWPSLVQQITDDGARVAVYGYFRINDKAYYDFDECIEELDVLHARQQKMAALHEDVIFVDGRNVVSPDSTPEAYAFDHVHPSDDGAELVGKLIATRILEAEEK